MTDPALVVPRAAGIGRSGEREAPPVPGPVEVVSVVEVLVVAIVVVVEVDLPWRSVLTAGLASLVAEAGTSLVAGPGYGSQGSYPEPNDGPSTTHQLGPPAVTRLGIRQPPMSTR